MSQQHTELSQKHEQPSVSPMTVTTAGLASVTAAIVTSSFGVAETLIGEALTAMIVAAVPAVFKAYLDSVGNATTGARILRSVIRTRKVLGWFFSLPPEGRRPILFGGLLAGVVAFFLGMGTVTAAELSASKSLSCWVWGNCPQGASEGTLPSVMGGGPNDDAWWNIEADRNEGSSWVIGGDPGNSEPPVAGRGPGDGGAPTTTEDTQEDTGPAKVTNAGETKEPRPCDAKEATTGGAEKDNVKSPAATVRDDGEGKGPKPCVPKQVDSSGSPEQEEPPDRTSQGRHGDTGAHGSRQGEPPVQPPIQKEDPAPEQHRREPGTPNDKPPREALESTNGGGDSKGGTAKETGQVSNVSFGK